MTNNINAPMFDSTNAHPTTHEGWAKLFDEALALDADEFSQDAYEENIIEIWLSWVEFHAEHLRALPSRTTQQQFDLDTFDAVYAKRVYPTDFDSNGNFVWGDGTLADDITA